MGEGECRVVEAVPLVVPEQSLLHLTGVQHLPELGEDSSAHLDADARVTTPEPCECQRQQGRARGGEGTEPQGALVEGGEGVQVGLCGAQFPADGPTALGQRGTRRGGTDTAGQPLDERLPRLLLQQGHLLGGGGGRHAEGFRRGGERTAFGGLGEQQQAAHVEHADDFSSAKPR